MPEANVYLDRSPYEHVCMSEVATNTAGTALDVSEYRHVVIGVATDGGADYAGTYKFQWSIRQTAPTWTSAASKTNHWDYVEAVDLEDGNSIDGDTGVTIAGADDYRLFEINTNALTWINVIQSSRTQGELTVWIRPSKD